MEDKIVEIARFYEPEAAQMIESLLKSEGVNCYLRNEYTSRIQYPANVGGIRIELLESEVPRAKEILEANGYEFPNEDEEDEQLQAVSGWVRHVPFLRHLPLEKQIIVLFILVAVFLALVIYFVACFIQLNNCKLWHAERLQIVKPYVSLFCGVSFAT